MFEMLSKYFTNKLYLTDTFKEKCKKDYNELYFGATKYCIKDLSDNVDDKNNVVEFD
jgi:hypothetical protein